MNILHIVAYYSATSVHKELYTQIDNISENNKQYVFIPRRNIEKFDSTKRIIHDRKNIKYLFYDKFTFLDSMMYYTRLNGAFKFLDASIDLKQMQIVHAHSLFIDGGIALKIKEKYNIDYVLSIRADALIYLDKMPHTWPMFEKIIKNAKAICFIAPNMIKVLRSRLSLDMLDDFDKKIYITPNGIGDYWHDNLYEQKHANKDVIIFVEVSEYIPRKRIIDSIKLVELLNKDGIKSTLTIAGTGQCYSKIEKYVNNKNIQDIIKLKGQINDINAMKQLYRDADIFIMLSKKETFGLVYIEAMTQGLPIIYREDTAVDGLFKTNVGFKINNRESIKQQYNTIKDNILKVLNNYDKISKNANEESKIFKWFRIANDFLDLYKK